MPSAVHGFLSQPTSNRFVQTPKSPGKMKGNTFFPQDPVVTNENHQFIHPAFVASSSASALFSGKNRFPKFLEKKNKKRRQNTRIGKQKKRPRSNGLLFLALKPGQIIPENSRQKKLRVKQPPRPLTPKRITMNFVTDILRNYKSCVN